MFFSRPYSIEKHHKTFSCYFFRLCGILIQLVVFDDVKYVIEKKDNICLMQIILNRIFDRFN
jgi:hypothetical protein